MEMLPTQLDTAQLGQTVLEHQAALDDSEILAFNIKFEHKVLTLVCINIHCAFLFRGPLKCILVLVYGGFFERISPSLHVQAA